MTSPDSPPVWEVAASPTTPTFPHHTLHWVFRRWWCVVVLPRRHGVALPDSAVVGRWWAGQVRTHHALGRCSAAAFPTTTSLVWWRYTCGCQFPMQQHLLPPTCFLRWFGYYRTDGTRQFRTPHRYLAAVHFVRVRRVPLPTVSLVLPTTRPLVHYYTCRLFTHHPAATSHTRYPPCHAVLPLPTVAGLAHTPCAPAGLSPLHQRFILPCPFTHAFDATARWTTRRPPLQRCSVSRTFRRFGYPATHHAMDATPPLTLSAVISHLHFPPCACPATPHLPPAGCGERLRCFCASHREFVVAACTCTATATANALPTAFARHDCHACACLPHHYRCGLDEPLRTFRRHIPRNHQHHIAAVSPQRLSLFAACARTIHRHHPLTRWFKVRFWDDTCGSRVLDTAQQVWNVCSLLTLPHLYHPPLLPGPCLPAPWTPALPNILPTLLPRVLGPWTDYRTVSHFRWIGGAGVTDRWVRYGTLPHTTTT